MQVFAFIAKRILIPKASSFSGFISRLCIFATAVSVAGMLLSSALFNGFEKAVTEKFYNAWGHVHIANTLPEMQLFNKDELFALSDTLKNNLDKDEQVQNYFSFVLKSALIYKKGKIQGIMLKGIDEKFLVSSFKDNIVLGRNLNLDKGIDYSRQILLSETQIKELNLKLNDSVVIYFFENIGNAPRARKMHIVGVYNTGLEENDKSFAYCDSRLVRNILADSLNGIHGIEINLKNYKMTDAFVDKSYAEYIQVPLQVFSIKEKFKNVFTWINLVKQDVWIVYIILVIVALINIVSSILILILERTNMIGLLKSIGMKNTEIKKVFYTQSIFITLIGITLGILLAIVLCYVQQQFHLIKLDAKIYYVSEAQVYLQIKDIFKVSVGVLALVAIIMVLPSIIVSKISPLKAVKFD